MPRKQSGLRVMDLFCGGGGFSEGFHQAGFDVVFGIDFWKPACDTHHTNGLGETRRMDLLETEVDDIVALKKELVKKYGEIDVVIGSPPCTEFSYAKKGGHGDIEEGMLLVRKHLEFVSVFKPKYWLMENVPRLESVLDKECEGSRQSGWKIPYEKLGIPHRRQRELGLEGEYLNIPVGTVFTAWEYGAPENRRRFIAGDFPIHLVDDQKVGKERDVSLGGVIGRLEAGIKAAGKNGTVADPNYPNHRVKRADVRDLDYDTSVHPMYWEEMRHLKRRHIQYGKMSLPEDLTLPARTIMATSNSSSRESILLETGRTVSYQGKNRDVYRQPTVREVACIQGFPLDFQLIADKLNDRYKLIGNAVPCQLSNALAKAILDGATSKPPTNEPGFSARAKTSGVRLAKNHGMPIITKPKRIVSEAKDIGDVHKEFRARENKSFRRKLLSSKLENDSSILIFENASVDGGKLRGGTEWKTCFQQGMGDTFHRVYLDEVSVSMILRALSAPLDSSDIKRLFRSLLDDVGKGVPVLKDGWVEFTGYASSQEMLSLVTKKRLRLADVALFQRAFTTDMPELHGFVGPIDFFDALDAVMLLNLCKEEFKGFANRMVFVPSMKDKGGYSSVLDSRVVPSLKNVEVPLVTLVAGLMSAEVLRIMYEGSKRGGYHDSILAAHGLITKWCSAQ